LQGSIDFGSTETIGVKPVAIDDVQHSQFKLNRHKYRDTNNFVVFNLVTVQDYMYFPSIEEYHFLNFKQNPLLESDVYIDKETVTTDGGMTFIDTEDHLLFGYYFFADENRNEY
jgi:hypothetical protein